MKKILFIAVFLCYTALSLAQSGIVLKKEVYVGGVLIETSYPKDDAVQINIENGYVTFNDAKTYFIERNIGDGMYNQSKYYAYHNQERVVLTIYKEHIVICDSHRTTTIYQYKVVEFKEAY